MAPNGIGKPILILRKAQSSDPDMCISQNLWATWSAVGRVFFVTRLMASLVSQCRLEPLAPKQTRFMGTREDIRGFVQQVFAWSGAHGETLGQGESEPQRKEMVARSCHVEVDSVAKRLQGEEV